MKVRFRRAILCWIVIGMFVGPRRNPRRSPLCIPPRWTESLALLGFTQSCLESAAVNDCADACSGCGTADNWALLIGVVYLVRQQDQHFAAAVRIEDGSNLEFSALPNDLHRSVDAAAHRARAKVLPLQARAGVAVCRIGVQAACPRWRCIAAEAAIRGHLQVAVGITYQRAG